MIVLIASALLLQQAPTIPDPLGPGREGWLGCVEPDLERKACLGLKSYEWAGDTIFIEGEAVVSADPLTTMHYRDKVTYIGDAVCSWTSDVEASLIAISVNGEALAGDAFISRRREIVGPLLPTAGQKYCVTFEPAQMGFTMRAWLEGVRQPELDRGMIWVRPDDGWTVAP